MKKSIYENITKGFYDRSLADSLNKLIKTNVDLTDQKDSESLTDLDNQSNPYFFKDLTLIEKSMLAKILFDLTNKTNEFIKDQKDKIYLINKEFANINLDQLRINNLGLYFGTISKGNLRLSIEGSQLVGPKATKNILELNDKQVKEWLKGEDVNIESELTGFLIIKNNKDYLGCGKIIENKLLNFIPKGRRIKTSD